MNASQRLDGDLGRLIKTESMLDLFLVRSCYVLVLDRYVLVLDCYVLVLDCY